MAPPRDDAARPSGASVRAGLRDRARWVWPEIAFWLLAFAAVPALPGQHLILAEIAGLALFVLSLDLILGYAGIVSLGHAAFFGVGAYAAGLASIHLTAEPLAGLGIAAAAAALVAFATSFLVLRGSDLTRLMVTLGVSFVLAEAANKAAWLTGGADGLQGVSTSPVFGLFEFDLFGRTAYAYSLVVLFLLFLLARRIVGSPFGSSLRAIRDNPLRASAIGVPVNARLVAVYTLAGAYAGIAGALFAQTQQFVSLEALSFQRSADALLILVIGGTGYLYGGLLGAIAYKLVHDVLAALTPQYWPFWMGLLLVVLVLVGRDRPRLLLARAAAALGVRGRRGPTTAPALPREQPGP